MVRLTPHPPAPGSPRKSPPSVGANVPQGGKGSLILGGQGIFFWWAAALSHECIHTAIDRGRPDGSPLQRW